MNEEIKIIERHWVIIDPLNDCEIVMVLQDVVYYLMQQDIHPRCKRTMRSFAITPVWITKQEFEALPKYDVSDMDHFFKRPDARIYKKML